MFINLLTTDVLCKKYYVDSAICLTIFNSKDIKRVYNYEKKCAVRKKKNRLLNLVYYLGISNKKVDPDPGLLSTHILPP